MQRFIDGWYSPRLNRHMEIVTYGYYGFPLLLFPTALFFIRKPMAFSFGGSLADAAVGFAGGILGGLAGLSGPLPTLWASVRGWTKDQRRGVFQIFNGTVLGAALCLQIASGFVQPNVF